MLSFPFNLNARLDPSYLPDGQIGLDMRFPAVLVLDGGIDVHDVVIRIQGVDNVFIAFFDECTAQLAGPGQFVVIRIELFVKIGKFCNPGGFGKVLVGLPDLRLHQIVDLRAAEKVPGSWCS